MKLNSFSLLGPCPSCGQRCRHPAALACPSGPASGPGSPGRPSPQPARRALSLGLLPGGDVGLGEPGEEDLGGATQGQVCKEPILRRGRQVKKQLKLGGDVLKNAYNWVFGC